MSTGRLVIENFAQIKRADIDFGDLTVLVGAQGTGKSLALQWLKVALDGKRISQALEDAGQYVDAANVVDLIFGVGMGTAWRKSSRVHWNNKVVGPRNIHRLGRESERVFFIPAHRSILINDGWASPFQKLSADTPVVARLFSQNLFDRFSGKMSSDLFPQDRVLKKEYRNLIDSAVFHGGTVGIDQDQQHSKRLKLIHGDSQLPFMTWTAGQREFTPLLLGLYHLLPPRKLKKRKDIDWVVIEEPEMGLHPQAISVFLMLALDLLWRGYRVVISTHSPHIVAALWMLKFLQQRRSRWQLVCEAFNVSSNGALSQVAKAALEKKICVQLLEFGADSAVVTSKDISSLDPFDEDEAVSGWGGLTGYTSHFADVVRKAAAEEQKSGRKKKR